MMYYVDNTFPYSVLKADKEKAANWGMGKHHKRKATARIVSLKLRCTYFLFNEKDESKYKKAKQALDEYVYNHPEETL